MFVCSDISENFANLSPSLPPLDLSSSRVSRHCCPPCPLFIPFFSCLAVDYFSNNFHLRVLPLLCSNCFRFFLSSALLAFPLVASPLQFPVFSLFSPLLFFVLSLVVVTRSFISFSFALLDLSHNRGTSERRCLGGCFAAGCWQLEGSSSRVLVVQRVGHLGSR